MSLIAYRYRWTGTAFVAMAGLSLAVLPFVAPQAHSQNIPLFAGSLLRQWMQALLDWPMGVRLVAMSLAAALVCAVATATLSVLSLNAEQEMHGANRRPVRLLIATARGLIASLMTAVLYILAVYATGYVGYLGPANMAWAFGIPLLIALLEMPRPRGVLYGLFLGVTGMTFLAGISLACGLPLD